MSQLTVDRSAIVSGTKALLISCSQRMRVALPRRSGAGLGAGAQVRDWAPIASVTLYLEKGYADAVMSRDAESSCGCGQ